MKKSGGFFEKIKKKINLELGNEPKSIERTQDGLITYYDWGQKNNAEEEWFTQFVRQHFPDLDIPLNFYGVCGKGRFVRRPQQGGKIFFTPENVDKKYMKWNVLFGDYGLPYVDLAMGFGNLNSEKYLRVPLWIQYIFSPQADKEEIIHTIEKINKTRYKKTKECALIAGHDKHGTRQMIYKGVEDLLQIDCGGRWHNNTTELWDHYENNKILYLKQFKFNICPENINTKDYVTEKLFEAFAADTIPVYYGSDNLPEKGIVNSDAIVFWEDHGDNKKARELLVRLKTDEVFYQTFIEQPKFLPGAAEYIYNLYVQLEQRLKDIINNEK